MCKAQHTLFQFAQHAKLIKSVDYWRMAISMLLNNNSHIKLLLLSK